MRLDSSGAAELRRPGFLSGEMLVPDDFDRIGGPEIENLF
jgi:hypothetical protein